MKTRDNLQSLTQTLALAAALAAAPALLAVAVWAEPTAAPKAAQQKTTPPATGDDDLSAPAAGAASKPATTGAVSQTKAKDVNLGTAVYGSDGLKVGEVKAVKTVEASGTVQEIHVATPADKTVVVPGTKIKRGGPNVLLVMTSDEVGKLPAFAEPKAPDPKG